MLLSNFLFIIRRFIRNKFTTSLHIIGLTLGIAVCLMIGLFIKYETTFDTYQSLSERTYRVNHVWIDFGQKNFDFSTPFPLADQIRKDVPGISYVTKVHHVFQGNVIEINPQKRFRQDRVMMTDPEFIDVFDVKVIEGDAKAALKKPYHAVLTASTARKFFGNENALNKTFIYNDSFNIIVGGVIEDFPVNTHLNASVLLSFADNQNYLMTNPTHYGSVSGGSTFIVLPEGVKPNNALQASLQSIYDRFLNNQEWMGKNSRSEIELQPLRDVHFESKYRGGGYWVKAINSSWLYFFGSVGFAVLVLACINFINLSTAQSLNRAKEIGVRKVVGAGRGQLILQFLSESLMLVFLSTLCALLLTKLTIPYINALSDKQLSFDFIQSPVLFFSLPGGILVTALLAGIYPAWIITKFHPSNTLKSGPVSSGLQSIFLRKGLVVVQFTISVCLLMALLLIGKQMNFMRHKNLGFDKENVIVFSLPVGGGSPELLTRSKKEVLENELSKVKGVKGWSFSTSPPSGGENTHWGTLMSMTGPDDPGQKHVVTIMTDANYPSVYNLQLVAGRFFVESDTNAIAGSVPGDRLFPKTIVNEKLIKELGFKSAEEAIGQRFWAGINDWHPEIVGVVKDFNVGSLHEEVKPTMLTQYLPFCRKLSVKITGRDAPVTIAGIETAYKHVFPKGFFEFSFLDEALDALYKSEVRLYNLFRIFSALALLISCLGLWGLITYAAKQRVKEIGIRKVLGASVTNIVTLLTKDFVMLVSISIVIATPLAYWGIYKWLQDFAYRINIGWVLFVIAGGAAVLIALITVSVQAFKAAAANPVNSLRNE
ncbi:MAG: ABC transporter permease [Chitinophagaceae bacterium]|nr:ABC transporter permease [Chitinophagaceae bacterium]